MTRQVCLLTLALALPMAAQDPDPAPDPAALQREGTEQFFAGRMKEALAAWDRVVELEPRQAPYHWQRGIALYYAGRYEDGVAQFESHQTVNPQDVENAVWHFLCVVRAKDGSVELARKKYIPITRDPRVPMKEIHALFAGSGSEEAVLKAAQAPQDEPGRLRNHLCYAHLYLGLYHEALGHPDRSLAHMKKAAVDYRMDHYMGRVAQVHYQLRRTDKEAPAPEAPEKP